MRAVKVKHKLNVLADLAFLERLHFAAPAVLDEAALLEVRVHEIGDLKTSGTQRNQRERHTRNPGGENMKECWGDTIFVGNVHS